MAYSPHRILGFIVSTFVVSQWVITPSLAQTETRAFGSQVTLCVVWSQGTPPAEDVHFAVDFSSPLNPAVELLTGDAGWVVYATLNSTGNPANIASIATPAADNFVVQVVNPEGGPGAADVGEILLQPTSSSNYANFAGGEIAGDLAGGLVLQRSSGGSGGVLTGVFQIHGAIGGTVDIPVIDGTSAGWF